LDSWVEVEQAQAIRNAGTGFANSSGKKILSTKNASSNTLDPNLYALQNLLSAQIGCKVAIAFDAKKGNGRLSIDFHHLDVLSGFLEKIGVEL